ncbi:hypothetical protein [Thermaerobacillus caldiproteolyticus]|uniref:hypothetical protein n=1 Tax=Thermaerobacillus caldiproteolyticus TaxID=247480 RepID=UPI00188C82F8|nr:hypothetical protein [Anoxybacillus caldiproteolyticus]QPA31784.1 hypothetical protein ISX45_01875 [Anoxybacillus caldiproteolyticus]
MQKSYANELLGTKPNMNSIIELQKGLEFTEESLAVDIDKAKIETEIKINKDEAIKIQSDNKFKPQSQYGVGGLILNTQDSLTEEDPMDLFFFSPTSDKILVSRILSGNEDYILQLYVVDYENGLAYPTEFTTSPGKLMLINIPAGDYALGVLSKGTLGDSYTIQMNASNPANFNEAL